MAGHVAPTNVSLFQRLVDTLVEKATPVAAGAAAVALLLDSFHVLQVSTDVKLSATLFIVALLAIGLYSQHKKMDEHNTAVEGHLSNLKYYSNLPDRVRGRVHHISEAHIKLSHFQAHLQPDDTHFSATAEMILAEQERQLSALANGAINVDMPICPWAHGKISTKYHARLDAVSESDLKFWLDQPTGAEYFRQNEKTVRNMSTNVNRIFILKMEDLSRCRADIVQVLRQHLKGNMGFAVAIAEHLDPRTEQIKEQNSLCYDFALYNTDQAVSYFIRENSKRFVVKFATRDGQHNNNVEIARQADLYAHLVYECYLVNEKFRQTFRGALSAQSGRRLDALNQEYLSGRPQLNENDFKDQVRCSGGSSRLTPTTPILRR